MQTPSHNAPRIRLRETLLKAPAVCGQVKNRRKLHGRDKELVAIGDLHGELDGFLELLLHSALINGRGRWRGGNKTLVQMGDVIDRGPHAVEVTNLLVRLQGEAERKGGKVVRLLGNHELELLRGNGYLTTLPPETALDYHRQLAADILNGKVLGAYSQQGYLFTHAGLTGELIEQITRAAGPLPPDEAALADYINNVLVRAVMGNDFTHPIFNIGASRGGRHRHGGIFWEDVRELFSSPGAASIRQVVGHTPLRRVAQSDGGRLVAIDVGIYKGYGGGRAYLRLKRGKITVQELVPAGR